MRSKKILQALGKSIAEQIGFLLPQASIRILRPTQLKESTYKEIGTIYWQMRMNTLFTISDETLNDFIAHAVFDKKPYLQALERQPSTLDETNRITNTSRALLTQTLQSLKSTPEDIAKYPQSTSNEQMLTRFIFPFLILTKAYAHLPNDVANRQKYCKAHELISFNPSRIPEALMIFGMLSIMPMISECTADLEALDKNLLRLENASSTTGAGTNNHPGHVNGGTTTTAVSSSSASNGFTQCKSK